MWLVGAAKGGRVCFGGGGGDGRDDDDDDHHGHHGHHDNHLDDEINK